MTGTDNDSEIFDRKRRRVVRDRAYSRAKGRDFLHTEMANDLYDRLQLVSRSFKNCLLVGLGSKLLADKLKAREMKLTFADASYLMTGTIGGIQCDEDRLPFADASFDLIISIGNLDTVNDLPGALSLIRRILVPDGLFLGALLGAESLTTLKAVLLEAEGDRVRNHIHPQIDIRTMGDLLQRAGFALPVVDSDTLNLRYSAFERLIADIRNYGGSNLLHGKMHPIARPAAQIVPDFFTNRADEQGRTTEHLEIIQLSGWAPHPDQPKAARRGSGQISLKKALNDRT